MKIGKFKMMIMYDMQCGKCEGWRSNIGWQGSIFKKPTVKQLKAEGWTVENGINICPECNKVQ